MQFFSKSSLSFLFLLSSFFLALQVVEAEGLIKVRNPTQSSPSFSNNHSLSERHNKPATCECPMTGGSASTGGSGGPSKGNGNGPSVSGGLQGIFQSGNCQTKNGFATSLDAVFDSFHKDVSSSLTFLASDEIKSCSATKLEKKLKVVHDACSELSGALQWVVSQKITFSATDIFALESSIKSDVNVLLVQFADALQSIEELDGSLLVKFSSLLSELDVSLGSIISSLHTCLTGSVNICKTKVTTLSSVIASLSAKIEGLVKKPAPSKGHHGHSQGSSSYSGQGGFSYTQKGGLFGCLQKIFGASFGAGFKTCDK